MIEQVVRELAQGVRALLRTPILAVVVILSLAVGIGVNTVVFSWLQALVLRPIPGVADASAYYVIEPRSETGTSAGSSWPEYLDLKAQLRALPDLFAHRMVPLNVGEASRTERTYGLLVSGNYFSALGLRPVLGRFIRADEVTRPGAEAVVVISYGYWQTRFAGSPNAIGQTLRANGRDLTVIGVTPDQFQGTVMGVQFDLWVPATLAPSLFAGSRELEDRNLRGYYVMSTLAARTTREAAQAEIDTAMRQLASTFPESNRTIRADLVPYWRASRGPQMFLIQAVAVLQAVMLVLLLAVCGNTANLVLARATARQREIGVRLALGAGTWRIVRLLLVENVALGLGAAALGALFAMWGTQALRAVPLFTTAVPVRFQTSVNESGLVFAILLGVACAVIFGAAPAWHLARVDPQQVLRSGAATPGRRRLRNALMAAEVTLASVVLISAGLFLESFRETRDDPGFQREGLMLAAYDLSGRDINTDAQASDFARRLLDGLRAIPDVEVAALASAVPLDIHGMPQRSFRLEGRARTDGALDRALSNTVTPGYLQAMRIPLVAGRDFVELGDPSAAPQAIVNEEFVRRYVGDGEVLGRRLENNGRTYVISGVAKNALYEAYGEEAAPIIYFSYRDRPSWMGEIHVRARLGEETLLGPAINRVVRDIDASLPVYNVRTMMQHVEMNLAIRRIPARMFVVLGPLLLVLAAVGIYAVVAYTVAHRTTEIGVRIALGATATGVVAQIVRESLRVVVAGAVVGWVIVFMAYIHLVRRPLDIPSFVGVPILLLVVATIASWIPARRATSVDPMVALRRE
jgi:predicted permease